MAAVTDVSMQNADTGEWFLFRGVHNWRVKKSQPVISIPIVNTAPSSTFLFRFFGQTEVISFGFTLFDDGTDVSSGSPGGVNTLLEQVNHLKNDFYSAGFDVNWTISQGVYYGSPTDVIITSIDFDSKIGQGTKLATGTITMIRGNIGAI